MSTQPWRTCVTAPTRSPFPDHCGRKGVCSRSTLRVDRCLLLLGGGRHDPCHPSLARPSGRSFLLVLSLSGAALSLFPAAERLSAPQAEAGLSVATLAGRILTVYPQIEQIRRAPSGKITAYWFEDGAPQAAIIDPATGLDVASSDPNAVEQWLTGLHRSLFLGDGGRIAAAVGAAAMLVLAVSGTILVARRPAAGGDGSRRYAGRSSEDCMSRSRASPSQASFCPRSPHCG